MNLAERCEHLEEENRQLKEVLRGSDAARFPPKWRLSVAEKKILRSLLSAGDGFRTHDALRSVCVMHDETDVAVVAVHISRIRKKLSPYGVEIHSIWGEGYKISAYSKAAILSAKLREVV